MKKLSAILLILGLALSLSGCALGELIHGKDDVVDLGDGEVFVKWILVENNNEYSTVTDAYFEFNKDSFRYYENGALKKEGTHRITHYGVENTISPLHLNLNFGDDENSFSVFDYIDCYTEDSKDDLLQFTIMSEGYHIDPPRSGGVPVRDYHLSEMPYAFGTYVKESCERYDYANGKANYLGSAKLDGTFVDERGNKFYFVNNSYSSVPESSSYTVYMRYENNVNGTYVEGTIHLSYFEEFDTGKHHDVALVYVMHGDSEPSEESGISVEADFELMDFTFTDDGSIIFADADYFGDSRECDYDPQNFLGGKYIKID